ncbi:MAG: hypothetical protein K8F25_01520, partial [Fimbriimonadaceae bacterium]|nr:hypothetical protein [Alphaproteobacteria bacterium]
MDNNLGIDLALTSIPEEISADNLSAPVLPRRTGDENDAAKPPSSATRVDEAHANPRGHLIHDISVEHLDDPAALATIRGAWIRLATNALEPNVLLDPAFAFPALAHLARKQQVRFTLVWLEPHADSAEERRLIGLFPMTEFGYRWGLPVRGARAWEHIHSFETTPLLDAAHARMAAEGFFHALRSDTSRPRFLLFQLLPRNKVWAVFDQVFMQNKFRVDQFDNRERAMLKSALTDGDAYLTQ